MRRRVHPEPVRPDCLFRHMQVATQAAAKRERETA
jgi:hypothetical protein